MLSSFLYTVNLFQPLDIIRIVASRRVLFELFLHNLESLRVIPAPYCFISLSLCFLGRFAWLHLIRFILLLLLLLELLELPLNELIVGFGVRVLRAELHRALVILEGFLPRLRALLRVGIALSEVVERVAFIVIRQPLEFQIRRREGCVELLGRFLKLPVPVVRRGRVEVQAWVVTLALQQLLVFLERLVVVAGLVFA